MPANGDMIITRKICSCPENKWVTPIIEGANTFLKTEKGALLSTQAGTTAATASLVEDVVEPVEIKRGSLMAQRIFKNKYKQATLDRLSNMMVPAHPREKMDRQVMFDRTIIRKSSISWSFGIIINQRLNGSLR